MLKNLLIRAYVIITGTILTGFLWFAYTVAAQNRKDPFLLAVPLLVCIVIQVIIVEAYHESRRSR